MRLTHRLPALLTSAVLAVSACSAPGSGDRPAGGRSPASPTSTPTDAAEPSDTSTPTPTDAAEPSATSTPQDAVKARPNRQLPWGPTGRELAEATRLVSGWSAERLAGQVIVGRYVGTDPAEAADLVRDLHLAGLAVASDNVVDEPQVRALTRALTLAVAADGRTFPPVIGVDQEGGLVAHLGSVATDYPSFDTAGSAIAANGRAGRAVVQRAAYTSGLELRDLGFTWVFAPVADVTIGAADPTIGSRSPSSDPATAAAATLAAGDGYDAAGIVSTTKHFPGHGGVTADSHDTLPVLGSTMAELRSRDLVPFEDAVAAGAPAVMVGHLDVTALAPGTPSTLAPEVYDLLRDDLGFEGVAITDSLGMGALAGLPKPAVTALNAGADLLLMPPDTRRTHREVTAAIRSGEVSRERAERAAARVVALQKWQARVARKVKVPADVETRAAAAAAALSAGG
ncbi:MAG: glycoside hydrolase family 3 N-terminal domain-containing protein [Nocardioides sp.]